MKKSITLYVVFFLINTILAHQTLDELDDAKSDFDIAMKEHKSRWVVIGLPLLMLCGFNIVFLFVIYKCFGSNEKLIPAEKLFEFHGKFKKLKNEPIITTNMSHRLTELAEKERCENINGPSVVKVPSWVKKPLGKYYMYFAHYKGDHIRLAYANKVEGPWKISETGVFDIKESGFPTDTVPELSVYNAFLELWRQFSIYIIKD